MKAWMAGIAMMSAVTVAYAATKIGGDDFNDNSVNPAWTVLYADPGPAFTEINQRLEYTNPSGEKFIGWYWTDTPLSATQDWAVAIDFSWLLDPNTLDPSQRTDFQLGVDNVTNSFALKFQITQGGFGFSTEAGDVVADTNYFEAFQSITASQVTMRISFDASTETMTASYDSGGGYTTLTNLNISGWGLSGSSSFTPYIGSDNVNVPVSAGEAFADNFRIYDGVDVTLVDGVGIQTAVEIDWPSTSGATYLVQYTTNLASSNWVDLASIMATGTTSRAFDSIQGTQQRFYRVINP